MIMRYVLLAVLAVIVLLVVANVKKVVQVYQGIVGFFGEVRQETMKVSWPTNEEVINATILVSLMTVIFTIGVGVLDQFLASVVRLILAR
jgi:preprotein translocase SecE subunit